MRHAERRRAAPARARRPEAAASGAAPLLAVLDALPAHVAVLDAHGVIVAVNRAWGRFAAANAFAGTDAGVGTDYVALCEGARGACADAAAEVAAGLRAVLDGSREEFSLEYPCHAPSARRWFRLLATPLASGAVVTHVDVTERVESRAVLQERVRFEAMVAALSARFITCAFGEVDAVILEALRQIGEFTGVDRVYLLRFAADAARVECTHEWCAAGIGSMGELATAWSLADYPWTGAHYRRGEAVRIDRVASLPPEAAAERASSEAAGVRSSLLVPVSYGDELAGVIGCAMLRAERVWSEDACTFLKIVGEMAINALERQRAEAALHRHASRQEALVGLSQLLLAGPPPQAVFDAAASLAARMLGAEFSVVVELLPDGETLQSRAGVGFDASFGPTAVGAHEASHTGFTVARGEPVVLADSRSETRFAIPPVLRRHGVISGIGVPIGSPAHPFGCIAVYSSVQRDFAGEDIAFLQGLAHSMATAIERERTARLEKYLAGIVATSEDAIIGKTLDGTIVSWNPAAERLYGYRADEVVGKPIAIIVPPDRRDELAGIFARLRAGQAISQLETVRLHRDGRALDVSLSVSPIVDGEGRVTGAAAITRDIGEAKRTAAALQRFTERLQGLWEIDHAILAAAAPETIARAAITRLRMLVGCDRASLTVFDEAAGAMTLLVSDGLEVASLPAGARLTLDDLGDLAPLRAGTIHVVDDLGAVEPATGHGVALREAGLRSLARVPMVAAGELIGLVTLASTRAGGIAPGHLEIAREVTNQLAVAIRQARLYEQVQRHAEQLERRVQERTLQLEAANRELEAFSYSVSHDLRAPLRGIDGFARLLAEECAAQLDENGRHYLARVLASAGRMQELIDGLLDLARVTRSDLNWQTVDLSELARTIAADLRDPGRDVEFVIAPDLRVQGDLRLLRVVLENLLGNAWKYTGRHARARIELGCLTAGGTPVYFVRDDGAGFDMAYADRLFRPFKRLHSPSDFEGTGIGLATVQRIIHRHGGRVWAEAAPERGATFFFTLGPPPGGVDAALA